MVAALPRYGAGRLLLHADAEPDDHRLHVDDGFRAPPARLAATDREERRHSRVHPVVRLRPLFSSGRSPRSFGSRPLSVSGYRHLLCLFPCRLSRPLLLSFLFLLFLFAISLFFSPFSFLLF